jgi:hypothetical protein
MYSNINLKVTAQRFPLKLSLNKSIKSQERVSYVCGHVNMGVVLANKKVYNLIGQNLERNIINPCTVIVN